MRDAHSWMNKQNKHIAQTTQINKQQTHNTDYTDEVERVTGVKEKQVRRTAKLMADNRPGTFIWCMGGTQHTILF